MFGEMGGKWKWGSPSRIQGNGEFQEGSDWQCHMLQRIKTRGLLHVHWIWHKEIHWWTWWEPCHKSGSKMQRPGGSRVTEGWADLAWRTRTSGAISHLPAPSPPLCCFGLLSHQQTWWLSGNYIYCFLQSKVCATVTFDMEGSSCCIAMSYLRRLCAR